MRKLTKGLLIAFVVAALCWSALSALYTHEVARELTLLKQESHGDVNYLRCRLRELESEFVASIIERLPTASLPVGGEPETETDAESNTKAEVTDTEQVTATETLPTHESPETRPSADADAVAPQYLLTVHEGRVALLDAAGEVVETVNVFVMTLPAADRAALEVGIPVSSPEEARVMLEKYR